jgi:hypothetical protein
MTAQLATVGGRILAQVEDAGVIRDGSIIPSISADRPPIRRMQFDSGYLSPYFISDPARMEVFFDNVYSPSRSPTKRRLWTWPSMAPQIS